MTRAMKAAMQIPRNPGNELDCGGGMAGCVLLGWLSAAHMELGRTTGFDVYIHISASMTESVNSG